MAKIRSIHPEACESPDLERLSDGAERTFWRLLTHTDDEGRGKDDPLLLAAKLYPLAEDKDAATLKSHMGELADAGLIVQYENGGKPYYWIPTWANYQKPKYKSASKHPSPEDPSSTRRGVGEPTSNPHRTPVAPQPPPDLPHGEGVGVVVGEGVGGVTPAVADAPTAPKPKRATQIPAGWKPNDTHREIARERGVDVEAEAVQFRDHAQANGRTLKDWDAGFRTWLRRAWPPKGGGKATTREQTWMELNEANRNDPNYWLQGTGREA